MHRWFLLVVTGLAALTALTAVSAAAPGEPASGAAAAPAISSVSPKTLASGQRTTIKGRRFVTGKRRNTVVFLGRRGKRDDVRVKATATTTRKIVLKAPRVRLTAANVRASAATQAVSGPLQVINSLGKSKASRTKVTFDQDKDGLSNEREIQLGTNPRKADTDGDGVRDGRDSDPLNPPAGGGSTPGGGGGTPQPIPTDCPATSPTGQAGGPSSVFEGLDAARSQISHGAVVGTRFYCLYRKKRNDADSAYTLVAKSNNPDPGILVDGGSPVRTEDYLFRTDALTGSALLTGANTVAVRGAAVIAAINGWSGLNQTCAICGSSSVSSTSLDLAASGTGLAGSAVGSTAVYSQRLAFNTSGEWVARALTPPTPLQGYVSANLTISTEHPAVARSSTTVADLKASGQPFINVELRALANNQLNVIVTDSAGPVTFSSTGNSDLRSLYVTAITGPITNSYLTIQPVAGNKYEVRFKTNANDTDVTLFSDRAIPGGMTSGWLSLRSEQDSRESTSRQVKFDSINVNGSQPSGLVEYFGDPPLPPPPPPPAP